MPFFWKDQNQLPSMIKAKTLYAFENSSTLKCKSIIKIVTCIINHIRSLTHSLFFILNIIIKFTIQQLIN